MSAMECCTEEKEHEVNRDMELWTDGSWRMGILTTKMDQIYITYTNYV